MAVIYEQQKSDTAWYADPIPNGAAKDNFDRIRELRKAFCHPLTIHKDGTLNEKYFSTQTKETAMNWSDIETLQLYEGIYKHGVASTENWIKIKGDFLPQRDFIEVRLKLSQIFGVQDLSIYKGVKFESEKQISDEFEKNKASAIKNGCWNEKCGVALKQELVALSKSDVRKLQENELANWKKNIYENPQYIYRTTTNRTSNKSKKSKNAKKGNNEKKKVQKNTIDKMLKKQGKDANDEKKKSDKMEMDLNEDEDAKMNEKTQTEKKKNKAAKKE